MSCLGICPVTNLGPTAPKTNKDIRHPSPGRALGMNSRSGHCELYISPKLTWKPIEYPCRRTVVEIGPSLGFHVSFRECTSHCFVLSRPRPKSPPSPLFFGFRSLIHNTELGKNPLRSYLAGYIGEYLE